MHPRASGKTTGPLARSELTVVKERRRGHEVGRSCDSADDGPVLQRVVPALADLCDVAFAKPPRDALGDQGQCIPRQRPDSPLGFSAGDIDHADLVAWLDENGELVERRLDPLRFDGSSAGAEQEKHRATDRGSLHCRITGYLRLVPVPTLDSSRCHRPRPLHTGRPDASRSVHVLSPFLICLAITTGSLSMVTREPRISSVSPLVSVIPFSMR
jgi:hypothetical protein